MALKKMPPIHPGKLLLEEFLGPLEVSQYRLAKEIMVPARRINEIVHGKRGITADTALRLARFFGNCAQFWMNLQTHYGLETGSAGSSTQGNGPIQRNELGPARAPCAPPNLNRRPQATPPLIAGETTWPNERKRDRERANGSGD